MKALGLILVFVLLALAACGGDGDSADTVDAGGESADTAPGSESGPSDSDVPENAAATLQLDDQTFTWSANEYTICNFDTTSIEAGAYFGDGFGGVGDYDYFDFAARKDGGISFNLRVNGEEYAFGSGDAPEIDGRSFVYTETLVGDEFSELTLEVSC